MTNHSKLFSSILILNQSTIMQSSYSQKINYSVIVPHFNSVETLSRLLDSIPKRNDIQVIVVDDMSNDGGFERIKSNGAYAHVCLTKLECKRFAGGARNKGISMATGSWILFADADDYFTPNAFEAFDQYSDATCDIVIFKAHAINDVTNQRSSRNDNNLFFHHLGGVIGALGIVSPWAKMIKRDLVETNDLRFSEVVASNDVSFSRNVALAAGLIKFSKYVVYTVSETDCSLTKQISEPYVICRLIEHRKSIEAVKQSNRVNMVAFSFLQGNYVQFGRFNGASDEYKKELRILRKVLGYNVYTSMAGFLFKSIFTLASKLRNRLTWSKVA